MEYCFCSAEHLQLYIFLQDSYRLFFYHRNFLMSCLAFAATLNLRGVKGAMPPDERPKRVSLKSW